MANFFDKILVNFQSRSGVNLDYTPEDTLKSFIMEKRLAPITSDENAPNSVDSNSHNMRPAKSLKFYPTAQTCRPPPKHNQNPTRAFSKPPEHDKKPFLRKNQGRAAWCSRLRSSMTKLQEYSTRMRTDPLTDAPSLNLVDSGEQEEALQSKIDSLGPISFSNRPTKIYTHNSQWNPLPKQTLFPIIDEECCDVGGLSPPTEGRPICDIQSLPKQESVYIAAGATLNDLSDNGELEEFEMLERFAENQVCEGSNMSGGEVHTPSMVSKRPGAAIFPTTTVEAPIIAGDMNGFNDNRHIGIDDERTDAMVTKLQNPFRGCKVMNEASTTQPQPPPKPITEPALPSNGIGLVTAESVSSVFDDQVPWKEGDEYDAELTGIVNASQDSMALLSAHQQLIPTVRFDLPAPIGGPNHSTSNAPKVEGDSSLEAAPTPSPSVIKDWIARLEGEVNRFNAENAALLKLKAEREEAISALEKSKQEFEKYKEATMKGFAATRQEEINKLKKERKVLADYHRSMQAMPNKRDREEIERLKQQLSDEKVEAAQRETRLQQQVSRQRSRIEELSAEKTELLERIKRLEQARFTLQNTLTEERNNRSNRRPPVLATLSEERSKEAPQDNSDCTFATCKTQSQIDSVSQGVSFQPHTKSLVSQMVNRLQSQQLPTQPGRRFHSPPLPLALTSKTTTSEDLPVMLPPAPSAADSLTEGYAERSLPAPPTSRQLHATATSLAAVAIAQPTTTRHLRRARTSSAASDYYTGEEDCSSADIRKGRASSSNALDSPMVVEPNRGPIVREVCHPDGSLERQYCDGSKVIKYGNGSRKEIFPDGMSSVVNLFNGDTKRTLPDGTVVYCYALEGTVQTTYPDGTEEVVYKDGRKEVNYSKSKAPPVAAVSLASASTADVRTTPVPLHKHPLTRSKSIPSIPTTASPLPAEMTNASACASPPLTGEHLQPILIEESHPADGMAMRIFSNGDKVISLANGQKEVHCDAFKRRIYPDGTLKTVFKDGRQETCYASGRIRVKDALGNLLVDTRIAPLSQAAAAQMASLVMPLHLMV